MKKLSYLFLLPILLFCNTSFAQFQADDIIGLWMPSNGRARINIIKKNEQYYGKIVWLKEPNTPEGKPKVDKNNPDESKRTVPLLGYPLLKDFTFTDQAWENGTIYDPENGSTYSCVIKMSDKNTLDVRGFIGVSLFGRTDTWKRIQIKK